MIGYETLKTTIRSAWTLDPTQPVPTVYDKDLYYCITYPNALFLKMYKTIPTQSLAASGQVVMQKQIITITGVYTTFNLASSAQEEIIRILQANKYRIDDKGTIMRTTNAHVFSIRCKHFEVLS